MRLPAGDLDLTDGPSAADPDHFAAYRELLYPRLAREVADGILQVLLVETGIDPDTGEVVELHCTYDPSTRSGAGSGIASCRR